MSARQAVDRLMQGRTLNVVIEQRPVPCTPSLDSCYSRYHPKLRWVQDATPKLACRSAMLPYKRRLSYKLTDEGELPFAPTAVFARTADPQDAWIDWRGVTRVVHADKVVRIHAPLNAYRVLFTFSSTRDATMAAERFEALRTACADSLAPVTELFQAYRIATKLLEADAVAVRTRFHDDTRFDKDLRDVTIGYFREGMCEGGYVGGLVAGKPFTVAFPDLKHPAKVARDGNVVRIDTPVQRYAVEFELKTTERADALVDAMGFIATWCRTEYGPTKFYRRIW